MRLTLPLIRRLPKTDIHCHLDGCLRPRTVLELADAQKVKLPTRKLGELRQMLTAGRRIRSLGDYLRIFDLTLSVLQTREALYRVAFELVITSYSIHYTKLYENLANGYITEVTLPVAGTVKTTGPLMHFSHAEPFRHAGRQADHGVQQRQQPAGQRRRGKVLRIRGEQERQQKSYTFV